MKPIYVLVKESGDFGYGGSRKIRAYTTPARAKVQMVGQDTLVTYMPILDTERVVSREHYDYLIDRDHFLQALESAGVDNWSGYGEAYEIYEEESE